MMKNKKKRLKLKLCCIVLFELNLMVSYFVVLTLTGCQLGMAFEALIGFFLGFINLN
jgi:hypothetical protein